MGLRDASGLPFGDYVSQLLRNETGITSGPFLTSGGLFPSSTPISSITTTTPTIGVDPERYEQLQKAEREVIRLGKQLSEINKELREARATGKAVTEKLQEKEKIEQEQKTQLERVAKEKEIQHIADRIEPAARKLLRRSPKAIRKCLEEGPCTAFVMSVDIRQSTALMLKAREPALFAQFITSLCDGLRQAVWSNHGVFDKFTGDGILAFFPLKYTGEDAGYFAIRAAAECHAIFTRQYKIHRHCFTSILADVGLGIGIDYGETHLVSLWGGLTVVGEPVVYACRLGGASAGQTLVDQEAYEITYDKYKACCTFGETVLPTKSDGNLIVYRVQLYETLQNPSPPPWWASLNDEEKRST